MNSRIVSCLPLLCAVAIAPFLITPSHSQVMIPSTTINCTTYNSSQPCIPGDRNVYCLTNGTTLRGICDAKLAVCEENAEIADNMDPCTLTTTQDPDNAGNSFMTQSHRHYKIIQIISSSFLVWIWLACYP